jgi:hypothetical protein
MIRAAAVFEGSPAELAAYADEVAPAYFVEQHQEGESPEDCAQAGISYWGQ